MTTRVIPDPIWRPGEFRFVGMLDPVSGTGWLSEVVGTAYGRSTTMAAPIPPPMHSDANPRRA
jgi:hypothetical protein